MSSFQDRHVEMRIKDCEVGHEQMEQFDSVSVLIYRYSARIKFFVRNHKSIHVSSPLSKVILIGTSKNL